MSTREKILSVVLGTFIVVAVAGAGGYFGIYLPVKNRQEQTEALEAETAEKQVNLVKLQKDMARLATVKARSLPADPDVARHEYTAALSKLLQDSRVPRGYTLRPKAPDGRPVPEIAAKKPAYQRIAFEITIKKVDLGTLIDLLERYYQLGLLHQITRFHVKRTEAEGASAAARRGTTTDRADLDVTLVTEAIILDGVDSRKTLRPIPPPFGAVVGSAGFTHLSQSPEAARNLPPPPGPTALADVDRDYLAILAKDPLHGPLPIPPAPPPPAPRDDVSRFVKLTGIMVSSDGTATASVKDAANNLDYEIEIAPKNGVLTPRVEKFYYIRDRRRPLGKGADLDISDDTSTTKRRFRVIGIVDADTIAPGLVLTADPGPVASDDRQRDDGGRFGRAGNRGRVPATIPATDPFAGVAGVAATASPTPPDRVYVWRVGQSLLALKELIGEEGVRAVERAKAGWETVPATVPAPGIPES